MQWQLTIEYQLSNRNVQLHKHNTEQHNNNTTQRLRWLVNDATTSITQHKIIDYQLEIID